MYELKTKALISCLVTAQLVCVFVLNSICKKQVSHDTVHIMLRRVRSLMMKQWRKMMTVKARWKQRKVWYIF